MSKKTLAFVNATTEKEEPMRKIKLSVILFVLCATLAVTACSSSEILSIDEEETKYFHSEYAKEIEYIELKYGIVVTAIDKDVAQYVGACAVDCLCGYLSPDEYRFLDMVSELNEAIGSGEPYDYGGYWLSFFSSVLN